MKIPPSGDNFRIPPSQPGGPEGPGQAKGAGFDAKIDAARTGEAGVTGSASAASGAAAAQRGEGPQAAKLRALLEGVDPSDPNAVGVAAEKLVDWHLTEQFGPGVLNARGIDEVRASVRDQLMNDPTAEAKIRSILSRL
ncbi:MAG: hypothetical protein IT349_11255 [Candidatus Eisenbacteria bacterium]|nr:hypothetical protein [Candidatus Eisenbacteria bacterium]MCC7142666.1 hypothetical protein [Candidatus Eisenbacteria bacterium]